MAIEEMQHVKKPDWGRVSFALAIYAAVSLMGTYISSQNGNVRNGNFGHKIIAIVGVFIFLGFSIVFLHLLTRTIRKTIIFHRLGAGRAAALQFVIRLLGYLAILFTTLDHIGVPVGHLLLGSAVLGIILGVAAQQALANFFASIVLIVSHPFTVGEDITLVSGALGGRYDGRVKDIGMTHTHIQEANGTIVSLPNSTLLTGAAVKAQRKKKPKPKES